MAGMETTGKGLSLRSRTLLQVLLPAVLVILAVGLWVRAVAHRTVQEEMGRRQSLHAKHIADIIDTQMDFIAAAAVNVARNDLIVNSLIDLTAREIYLPPFFNSLKIPGFPEAIIRMTDYRGRPIASNNWNNTGYQDQPWYAEVMKGHRHISVSPEIIRIATPIQYFGKTEGAVTVEFEPEVFRRIPALQSFSGRITMEDGQGRRLFAVDASPSEKSAGRTDAVLGTYRHALPHFSDITAVYTPAVDAAFTQLEGLDNFMIGALVVNLLSLLSGVLLNARIVSAPLKRFAARITAITASKNLNAAIDEEGPSEYRTVARAFNILLAELQTSTISRQQLEHIIKEKTTALETAQHELVRKAFQAGRAQLSGMILHNIGNLMTPLKVHGDQLKSHDALKLVCHGKSILRELFKAQKTTGAPTEGSREMQLLTDLKRLMTFLNKVETRRKQQINKLNDQINAIDDLLILQQSQMATPLMHNEIEHLLPIVAGKVHTSTNNATTAMHREKK